MATLEMCKKFYGTTDIYKIFGLSKDSSQSQIRKAYHSISLEMHPDRVAEAERETATQKFQVLSHVYSVLTNKEKKKLFDDKGVIKDDGDDDTLPVPTFLVPPTHIEKCKRLFMGSDAEKSAIRDAYREKRGNIKQIIKRVPFLSHEDEPRVANLLKEWVTTDQLPDYFENSSTTKQQSKRNACGGNSGNNGANK